MSTPVANQTEYISIDDLDLNAYDDLGARWQFDSIDGWHDGPSVDVEQAQRIVSHGVFAQPGHRGGRVITIKGWVYAPTRAGAAVAADRLVSLLADGTLGELSVTDADAGARRVMVQLFATPDIDWRDRNTLRFQLQLFAADAYRYGSVSSASTGFSADPVGAGMVWPAFPDGFADFGAQGTTGTVTISNDGTAPASAKFTVEGPTPDGGFTITDTTAGRTITYLGAVPTGSVLVLDGSDGSVVIDGTADRLGDTVVQAWPTIPAGGTRDFLFTPLGSTTAAVLTAETTATYW